MDRIINKVGGLLLVLATVFSFINVSAKSIINVKWPGSEGAMANSYTYSDFITFNKSKIASVKIASDGSFSVITNFTEVLPIYIQVQFFRFDILVEPNKNYNVEVSPTNVFDAKFAPSYILAYVKPEFKIVGDQAFGVNYELTRIDSLIGGFLDSNYLAIYKGQLDTNKYNSFNTQSRKLRSVLKSEYSRDFLDFEMIQVDYSLRRIGEKTIVEKLFSQKSLRYNSLAYMSFFNRFYSKYLITGIKGLKYNELEDNIALKKSYNDLSRLLSKDPLLQDSVVRQLVVLLNIQQMYTLRRFDKSGLEDILTDIAGRGITKQNKEIALRIKDNLLKFDDGKAFNYNLVDFSGLNHQLAEHEGKYVYLSAWNLGCKDCLMEMSYLAELNAEFDDIIDIVTVYVGNDTNTARKYFEEQGYNWQNLYFNNDFDFISNYKIELLPYYTLIGKNGQFEAFAPPHPSFGFKEFFVEMLNQKKNNLKVKE